MGTAHVEPGTAPPDFVPIGGEIRAEGLAPDTQAGSVVRWDPRPIGADQIIGVIEKVPTHGGRDFRLTRAVAL